MSGGFADTLLKRVKPLADSRSKDALGCLLALAGGFPSLMCDRPNRDPPQALGTEQTTHFGYRHPIAFDLLTVVGDLGT